MGGIILSVGRDNWELIRPCMGGIIFSVGRDNWEEYVSDANRKEDPELA